MRIERKGDRLALTYEGEERCSCNGAAGWDGFFGFVAHDVRIGIRKVEVHGRPDLQFGK